MEAEVEAEENRREVEAAGEVAVVVDTTGQYQERDQVVAVVVDTTDQDQTVAVDMIDRDPERDQAVADTTNQVQECLQTTEIPTEPKRDLDSANQSPAHRSKVSEIDSLFLLLPKTVEFSTKRRKKPRTLIIQFGMDGESFACGSWLLVG